jgi:amino acid adenylation domain-containing protein
MKGLGEVFQEGAHLNPNGPALIVEKTYHSFDELDLAARKWARCIRALRLGPGNRIGIFSYKTKPAYLGVLAAVFAGTTFVPLNPKVPARRTQQMIQRASLDAIFADADFLPQLLSALKGMQCIPKILLPNGTRAEVDIPVAFDADDFQMAVPIRELVRVHADGLAYILFTSGSSGQPKAVPISNSNVMSFLRYIQNRFCFSASDRFSQTFDLTFDLSIFDMFAAWGTGAAVCVPEPIQLISPARFIEENGVTVWFSVPSIAKLMLQKRILTPGSMPSLKWSLFCGEALTKLTAEAWQAAAPRSILENLYGPTELTIACSAHRWSPQSSPRLCHQGIVPIGRIFDGLTELVVDEELVPVPEGEIGELCIAGPQTFAGYFPVDSPASAYMFDRESSNGVTQFYRTGDLVRRLPEGEYVFLGRRDNQVKVSGYRIELAEVEAALLRAGLSDAVVVAWPNNTQAEALLAFGIGDVEMSVVQQDLRGSLPAYAIPRVIELVAALPLTANGKVDRQALVKRGDSMMLNLLK